MVRFAVIRYNFKLTFPNFIVYYQFAVDKETKVTIQFLLLFLIWKVSLEWSQYCSAEILAHFSKTVTRIIRKLWKTSVFLSSK